MPFNGPVGGNVLLAIRTGRQIAIALSRSSFERRDESANVASHPDLIELQRLDLVWNLSDWRQVIPDHARSSAVVIRSELSQQVIQMSLAEDDELRQTFQLDRLNEPFASAVEVGRSLRKLIRSHTS